MESNLFLSLKTIEIKHNHLLQHNNQWRQL